MREALSLGTWTIFTLVTVIMTNVVVMDGLALKRSTNTTCSRGSAAGAATLGARPERPVARRAEAAGGRGLEPGRRGAQAARGPELGGARPGRRRLRLEVRGGRGC